MEGPDLQALRALFCDRIEVPANTELFRQDEPGGLAYIVITGWAYCYKDLSDGGRQIINFQLTGDFVGLRNMLSAKPLDYGFTTLTACQLVACRPPQWEHLFRQHPRIATAIFSALAAEEAMLSEHLVNLGRRSADHRTAHFLCEIGQRLDALGLLDGNGFVCPVPQKHLADALGLSVVHLNRTLQKLRERGLLETQARGIRVTDLRGLVDFTAFDGDYLDR